MPRKRFSPEQIIVKLREAEIIESKVYRSFGDAKKLARSRKLKSWAEWIAYSKTGEFPPDIPAYPNQTYKGKGWLGIGDWLGTDKKR